MRGIMDDRQQQPCAFAFTPREQQVMTLAAFGLSSKAIARQLDLSDGTVRIHLHKIYQKIGVANRTALVAAIGRAEFAARARTTSEPRGH
jgi:two-component system nitrate/nitrite response regulator NarL